MEYNFLTNIENCYYGISSLIYYSHIPTAIVALFLSLFVYFKDKKSLLGKILLAISTVFSLWCIFNLILWVNPNSEILMFVWTLFGFLNPLLYILSIYFLYVFINKNKDASLKLKILWLLSLIPFIVLSYKNAVNFDIINCEASTNTVFDIFFYSFELFISIFILIYVFIKYGTIEKIFKKQVILLTVGVELFLFLFFFSGFLASYLVDKGLISDFGLEQYGLFGMTFFIGFLAFLIVRFKAFNIKLLGAQALVWSLIILIGSQFFFIQTTINKVLTGITLIISAIAGMLIVRSVKKEVALRERLEIANENQMVLVRFITHQVKGFFTKSKYIFAGLLEGDFGPISPEVKDVAQLGIESDKKAVDMIVDILNASNLKTGVTGFTFEEVNFGDFIREIADSFKQRALEKGLTFETKISDKALMVNLDKMQMTQVIKNLIDNAINYTPTGLVSVYLNEGIHDGKKIIKFSVTDSGVGLTEKDKSVLFREGGRGEESVKVNVNSTGYGLFIVKKIVEGHRGSIYATSDGRNKGATFTVELPKVGKK